MWKTRGSIDHRDMERINDLAAKAQQRTSAHILPVVVRSSTRFEHAEDLLGLWAAALGLALIWMFLAHVPIPSGRLPETSPRKIGLLVVLGVIVAGFLVGAMLITQIGHLRRWFIPRRKLIADLNRRARQVFGNCLLRLRKAGHCNLVMIYVSLCEKEVVIICDPALRSRIEPARLGLSPIVGSLRQLPRGWTNCVVCWRNTVLPARRAKQTKHNRCLSRVAVEIAFTGPLTAASSAQKHYPVVGQPAP